MIFQCSSSCRYPTNCSTPLLLLVVPISPYPFTMSACIQLHLLMLRFWASLIINLLILTHLLMMMVLQRFALSRIGVVHFFFCSLLAYCDYILNHSYAWLMMTSNRSFPLSMNSRLLLSMTSWVYHFSNLDGIFISFGPFRFLSTVYLETWWSTTWFFLHIGGNPMIVIGDILIRNNVQTTISQLLGHVGSPASLSHHSHQSCSSRSRGNSKIKSWISHWHTHWFHPLLPQFHLSRICLQWSHLTRHRLLSRWHHHHYLHYLKILKYRILPCL